MTSTITIDDFELLVDTCMDAWDRSAPAIACIRETAKRNNICITHDQILAIMKKALLICKRWNKP